MLRNSWHPLNFTHPDRVLDVPVATHLCVFILPFWYENSVSATTSSCYFFHDLHFQDSLCMWYI